jgi:DNA-binding NarL/FixJ family response regulator
VSPGTANEPGCAVVTVLIAESSSPIRQFLAGTIEGDAGLELVAICSDARQLRAALADRQPDVVVIDARIPPEPGEQGIQLARRLRADGAETGVVLLSQEAEPACVLALVESGPGRAYLRTERISRRDDLIAAIHAVARGGVVVDPAVVATVIEARARVARSPLPNLSRDERELLTLIGAGKSNPEIAHALGTSEAISGRRCATIFERLALRYTTDVYERVRTMLTYLAEEGS